MLFFVVILLFVTCFIANQVTGVLSTIYSVDRPSLNIWRTAGDAFGVSDIYSQRFSLFSNHLFFCVNCVKSSFDKDHVVSSVHRHYTMLRNDPNVLSANHSKVLSKMPSAIQMRLKKLRKGTWKSLVNQQKTKDFMEMESIFDGHTYDLNMSVPFYEPDREIKYYPWNDGVDYQNLCKIVRSRLSDTSTFYIISGSINGGIGHKYLSIYYSVTYALLLGRRFLIHMRDNFWSETNSCLHDFRYEGGYKGLYVCNKTSCIPKDISQNIENLPLAHIVTIDYRRPSIATSENLNILRGLGIIGPNDSWNEYRKRIMRLLLNPSDSNIMRIQDEWSRLQVPSVHVACHVRCGGLLADHPEITVMVSPEQLETIPSQIQGLVGKQLMANDTPVVYLSTDSTEAEKKLRSELPSMKLVTVKSLRRDHTTFADSSSLERAIMDLYLLCKSRVFLGTLGSGFSQVATMLCKPPQIHWISVNKTRIT